MGQQELPRELQTPGRGIQLLTRQVQENLGTLKRFIKQQENAVPELNQEVKAQFVKHLTHFSTTVVKMVDNQQQLLKCITDNQQKMETEMEQWSRTTKRLISEDLSKVEASVVSQVRFLVQQLQAEEQQDFKATFQSLKNSQEQFKEFHQHKNQMDAFCSDTQNFQSDMSDQLQTQVEKMKEMTTNQQEVSPANEYSSPGGIPITTTTTSVPIAKSDHLRLTFPTFGKPHEDPDPLNYLTRCQDFLALHPLSDVDLLATFHTVLYGTARDWWEVARTSLVTWTSSLHFFPKIMRTSWQKE